MTTILPLISTTAFAKWRMRLFIFLFFALVVLNSANAQCPSGSIVYVNANATGTTHDGSSWATAFITLQNALSAVENCTASRQIWVAKGTYYPDSAFRLQNKLAIYGGFAGGENNLAARNIKANKTILNGDLNKNNNPDDGDAISVVISLNVNSTAVLDGFTVTGAFSEIQSSIVNDPSSFDPLSDPFIFLGGAICNISGSPTLSNCRFSGNHAFSGGGIFNFYNANPNITNCVFSGNSATGGAGMANFYQSSPRLTNCVLSGNIAGVGAGIFNYNNCNPILINCTFSGNSASLGGIGVIYNDNSTPQLSNCIIWNNSETSLAGTSGPGLTFTTKVSSIVPSTSAVIKYSLVQNITTVDGNGNLDGITTAAGANYPLFLFPLRPDLAPSTAGDFHLRCHSPAIDKGNGNASPNEDLDGNPRIPQNNNDFDIGFGGFGSSLSDPNATFVDLGAYEKQTDCRAARSILYVNERNVNGSQTGASWATAFSSLQDALTAAATNDLIGEIRVAKGTYYAGEDSSSTFQLISDLAIYGGFNGTENSLSARNWKANITILNGDLNKNKVADKGDAENVTTGSNTDETAILDGFTITGGFNTNYVFSENNNHPTIGSSFPSIFALGGGGMFNNYGSPTVRNCIFSGNHTNFSGGGVSNINFSSPSVSNCIFSGNTTGDIYESSFSGSGGGLFNLNNSSPTITNCTFTGNTAAIGGGMYNGYSCNPTIANCIFSGDTATFFGGALANFYSSTATISNCTISGNKGGMGGGIANFQDANSYLINSIVWNNIEVNPINPIDLTSTSVYNTLNSKEEHTSSLLQYITFINDGKLGNLGPIVELIDPNYPSFAKPVDKTVFPNTTGNLHLRFGSPVIDIGNNNAAQEGLTTDLDGNSRIINNTIDLGAYENQGYTCSSGSILYVNEDAQGENDGSSWANAFTTLQDALLIANSCSAVKQIWVAKGIYYPTEGGNQYFLDRKATFSLKSNLAIYGGFAGKENSLLQRNYATNVTILSGDINKNNQLDEHDGGSVVTDSSIDKTAILDGFTITGGFSTGDNGKGGGMINNHASPTISNCIFSGNASQFIGGGMYNFNQSNPVVTNCVFAGNTADGLGGGMTNITSNPELVNCTFSGNKAGGHGGAMYNLLALPVITNCIIWNNKDVSGIGTASASIQNDQGGIPAITYSLIQSITTKVNGNLEGTSTKSNPNYPSFVTPVDLNSVPTPSGSLQLKCFSPAIDKGNNAANIISFDLGSSERKANGVIDLGAYENEGNCCTVNDTIYVNVNATGVKDGSSWENAFSTLQDALYITKSCTDKKQIWVAKGTYYPDEGFGKTDGDNNATFRLKSNLAIYGGFAGGETNLSERNYAANVTILSGDIDKNNALDYNDALAVVTGSGTDNTALLDGFTITGGNGNSGKPGGGMVNNPGSPAVRNCVFSGNTADIAGAGMYNYNSSPAVTNCIFFGNAAANGAGAMLNTTYSSPVITNCSFSGNMATRAYGGAMINYISNPVITNCIFWNNKDRLGTNAASSSISNSDVSSAPIITYSLVQGQTPAGVGNLDGITNAGNSNYPLFATPADPNTAPNNTGNLHPQCFLPVTDKGYNAADTLGTDLDGNPRIVNSTIDLGAYENQGRCVQPTTTTSSSSSNPSCVSNLTIFTSTVLINGNANTPAAGTVTFTQGATVLANNIALDASGQASFSTDTLGAGAHIIMATYNPPSTSFATSNGSVSQVVNARPAGTLSGGGTYCSGTNTITDLKINVTGSGTVSGTLSGNIQFSGTAPVINVSVSPTSSTTYMITSLMNANCTALSTDLYGSVMVTINPSPVVAAITGNSQVVKGSSITLSDATKGGVWSSDNTAIAKVSTTGAIKGISAGSCKIYYTVTSGECSAVASKSITVYNPLNATVSISRILCYGGTAMLTIKVSGGSDGYKYNLVGGKFTGNIFQTSNIFTVPAGKYIIIITDRMANQFTLREVNVLQPVPLAVKLENKKDASSKAAANGSFKVSGLGGTPGYKYSKNGGASYQSSGKFSGLATGSYKVSVKDANNCAMINYLTVNVGYNKQNQPLARNALTNESDEGDIKEVDDRDIKISALVFPNPSVSDFNLQLKSNKEETVEIRVMDVLGHAIYQTRGSATGLYKFGENFTAGMYIVEVVYKEEIKTLKIIKQ